MTFGENQYFDKVFLTQSDLIISDEVYFKQRVQQTCPNVINFGLTAVILSAVDIVS